MPQKILIFLILIISFGLLVFNLFGTEKVEASSADNVWGWAWGGFPELEGGVLKTGSGWIKFNNCTHPTNPATCGPINYGVNISTSTGMFSGYAWAGGGEEASGTPVPIIGWIKFDPVGPFPTSPNYSACLDLPGPGQVCDGVGDYTVSGWARACAGTANPDTTCDGTPNPAAGGWDGWIKLRGTSYGVWLDTASSPAEFQDWAWGGDDNNNEAVVGWVSFNCADTGICPTSPYKVVTDLSLTPPNDLPSATNLIATSGDCCFKARPPVELSWQYSDSNNVPPGTDDQSAYQVQVATSSGFTTIFVDSGNVTSSYNKYAPPILDFSSIYYWRVRVWDSHGTVSDCGSGPEGWCYPSSSFTTDPRPPWPDFKWYPGAPSVGAEIRFCSIYQVGICEIEPDDGWTTCYSSPCNWYWEFQDAIPNTHSAQNSTTTFTNIVVGGNRVALTVTDSIGLSCTKEHKIGITLPLPEYREVAPVTRLDNFLARLSNIFIKF